MNSKLLTFTNNPYLPKRDVYKRQMKHRYMIKVMLQTVMRSFILPKLTGGNAKGWYQNLDNDNSSK